MKTPSLGRTAWAQDGNSLLVSERSSTGGVVLQEQARDGGVIRECLTARQLHVAPSGRLALYRDDVGWHWYDLGQEKAISSAAAGSPVAAALDGGEVSWSSHEDKIVVVQRKSEPIRQASVLPGSTTAVTVTDVGEDFAARQQRPFAHVIVVSADLAAISHNWRVPGAVFGSQADSDALYLARHHHGTEGEAVPHTTLERLALETGERTVLLRLEGFHQNLSPKISPDGRWVAVLFDYDDRVWEDFVSVVLVDTATGELRRLTRDFYATSASWLPDSSGLVVNVRDRGWNQLYRIDVQGGSRRLTQSPSAKSAPLLSNDGTQVAFRTQDGYGKRELKHISTGGGEERTVQTLMDPAKELSLGNFERIFFPAHDGLSLGAFVIYPPGFDSSRKYPVLVDVHGGGPGSFLFLFGPLTSGVTQVGSPGTELEFAL